MNISILIDGNWVCTTIWVIILLKVVIEDQVLDTLLFLPLCLLLVLHRNCKVRIRWKFDGSCLRLINFCTTRMIPTFTLTCWRLPFFVKREKAIVFPATGPLVLGSADVEASRFLGRTGRATSNSCVRSNFRDSRLSAIILAYSRSKSASSSGSASSSCLVTMMASSSKAL